MASALHLATYGTYEEFCAAYDPVEMRRAGKEVMNDLLGLALINQDPVARLEIANRLLDDGADPSLISSGNDGINVLHALWGREMDREPGGEAVVIGRLLDGGADIDLRSPRFGLPLVCLATRVLPSPEYLRAAFGAVTGHSRPDLTLHVDNRREASVGQYLATGYHGVLHDEVYAYARAVGQNIDEIS